MTEQASSPTRAMVPTRAMAGPERPRWMDDPSLHLPCQRSGVDPDWWYAPEGWQADQLPTTTADADRATVLCHCCPMRSACATHGLRHEHHGTWGGYRLEGMTAATRRSLLASLAQWEHER